MLDDGLPFDIPDAQMSSGQCKVVEISDWSMNMKLYKEMVEKHKYLNRVICQDVFVKSCSPLREQISDTSKCSFVLLL